MSIENALERLAQAIEENTKIATLASEHMSRICTGTPCTDPEPEAEKPAAPAKKKAAVKKKAVPKAEPAPDPEPEGTPAEDESFPSDPKAALNVITEFVKGVFQATKGEENKAAKAAFGNVREDYGVERASEIPENQLGTFYEKTVEALKGFTASDDEV